jgi:ankyrin repeat protein
MGGVLAASEPGLIDAVKRRDPAAIRKLLAQKADANAAAPDGSTALHWAVEQDDLPSAAILISKGASAKVVNAHGATPLWIACNNGSAPMVELLLKAGADPNATSAEGESALMTAARTGSKEAVKLLLTRGVEVNRKESWRGQTALMWAAAEGHAPVVELLVEFGANFRERSNTGFTPLLFAVRQGQAAVVKLLLKAGADPNDALPARTRRPAGASTTEPGNIRPGLSALHLAVANGHFELAAGLLDAGASPNAAGPGWTPLHTLTWVRKPGTGSNDPAPAGSGTMDSLTLVRKFAAKGADLNARMTVRFNAGLSVLNTIGATPFLMAARTADAPYMRLLAELGADPKIPNADSSTPLMVAAGLGTRSPGEDAGAEAEVVEAIRTALDLGNDINAVDAKGETAMHGAAYKNLPAAVLSLAANGARIETWNQKNHIGWTPLRIAEGVHRTGNFRPSPPTAAAFRKIMADAGISTQLEDNLDPKTVR